MKAARATVRKNPGGRPPKFDEPSRPVTLTLPESILSDLEQIHSDRSHAIVEMTNKVLRSKGTENPLVEIVEMARNTGLVIVGPSRTLRKIPFLRLVEVAPTRFLLAVDHGHNFHSLEIAILDAVEDGQEEKRERDLLMQLLHHIKGLRKAQRVSRAEILFVSLP